MMIKCSRQDEKRILDYIGSDYPSCLYLYLDLLKYGFDTDSVEVYLQQQEKKVMAVLLRYYSCLHVYSRENAFDAKETATFFTANHFTILYCAAKTADRVYAAFSEAQAEKATVTKGWVAQIRKVDQAPKGLAVRADKEDFDQIVRLIYDDEDIGRSYKFDELAAQLKERNQQGYARNLVIKQNGVVIAHACTNAELKSISVVAELLVRNEYRRKGYASEIWRTICSELLGEGKEVYSFYYSEESRTLHKHIGFHEICEWAKIVVS